MDRPSISLHRPPDDAPALAAEPTVGRFTLSQLARLTGLSPRRLGGWVDRGWVVPAEVTDGVARFDFSQAASIRRLHELLSQGVSPRRIARSIRRLATWLPESEASLVGRLKLAHGERIAARLPSGMLAEPSGQLLLDLDDQQHVMALDFSSGWTVDELADLAFEWESSGRVADACDLYRRLVNECPNDAQLWLNYGNTLYALGQLDLAAEAFKSATIADPCFAEAWNNLGCVLMDQQRWDDAEAALARAISLRTNYTDARDNLADLASERA